MIRMIAVLGFLTAWQFSLCCNASPVSADETAADNDSKASLLSFQLPQVPQEAIQAATRGKRAFEHLILSDQLAVELGFESKAEAADPNISLGKPFPLIIVNVDLLKKYDPSMPPQTLISFSKQYIFPVNAKISGKTRSSVLVVELTNPESTHQDWKPIEWGKNGLILPLVQVRESYNDLNNTFALVIPALSRYFIGVLKEKDLIIIPLYSEPNYGFSMGVPISAVDVFNKIKKEAIALPIPKRGLKKGMS